ncbi:MAG: amino acid adenylation domain-containing protein [Paenibacillaceae bacterium]|nr:amino acid adenylation domain-containing protein [Paenibacillaceae bacterium]
MDNNKYILPFSAKSKEALVNTASQIIDHLIGNPQISLSDASFLLQSGRRAYHYRSTAVTSKAELNNLRPLEITETGAANNIIFAFPDTSDLWRWETFSEKVHNDGIHQLFQAGRAVVLDRLPAAIADKIKTGKASDPIISCYQAFANGYAGNHVLTESGITPTAYIGTGITELTAMSCSGALPVDHALEIIKRYGELSTYQSVYQKDQLRPRLIPIMRTPSQKASQHLQEGVLVKLGTSTLTNPVLDGCQVQPCKSFHLFTEDAPNIEDSFSNLIARLWCQGFDINWQKLAGCQTHKRIILPTYSFDKIAFVSDIKTEAGGDSNSSENKAACSGNLWVDPVEALKEFWSEIIGCREFNDNDDFFQLGGDSLTGIMLTSRIREQLKIDLTLSDIFAHSTFKKMSALVSKSFQETDNNEIPVLPKSEYYEASSAQKRMFVMNELIETGVPYNFADVYRVSGIINKNALNDAFVQLVNRHDAFRTRFDLMNGEVVQKIEDRVDFQVTYLTSNPTDLKTEIERNIRPFDLSQAPLLRVSVISLGEQDHVVVIDMHHIISDQTSLGILRKELLDIYENRPLPPLEIQYKDFAHWQNNYFKSGKLDSQLNYWKNEFTDGIPCLNLQTDFNRPEVMEYQGDKVTYQFDPQLCEAIRTASKAMGITPYMMMLAALNILLWKYTGQTEIPVGTAISGRKHSKLDAVVGMFVNTLVINTKINGQSTIEEYIQLVRSKMLSAFDNQDFQFEMLVEALDPSKNLSRNPLFDVFLNYVSVSLSQLEIGGNVWSAYEKDEIGIKQDLGFIIEENPVGFSLDVEYAKSLYCRETIELMGKRFLLILSKLSKGGCCTLNEISIISQEERHWLMNVVNQTQTDAPLDKTIISLFEEGVREQPEAPAIEWQDQKITYRQFNNMVNQMAGKLAKQQVTYKDIVPILLDWGPMQIISIFSIMKLGAAYLPIDPTYPQERIDFILQDSASKIIITEQSAQDKIGCPIQKFVVDADENILDPSVDFGLHSAYTPTKLNSEDICYVIYTSGSTGQPKGTRIRHRNVIRTVRDTNYVQMEAGDRIIQISNYVFDASVMNIFLALLNQACLVVIPRSLSIEIASLAQFIRERNITVFAIPTALFHLIADWDAKALRHVRRIIVGGEKMSLEHTKKALEIMGPGKLVDGYGPTESTVIATYYLINDLNRTNVIPIGHPVSNTTIYVMDDQKQLAPIGVPGELYIGGEGLAADYLNRPELTREKFAPLSAVNGQRAYATGDIVMWNSKGELIYLGRKDFQHKINGYRIELEEVERYLETVDGVKKAVVTAPTDDNGVVYLKAYCTLRDYNKRDFFDQNYIRTSLRKKVPEYMVPEKYVILPEFPLNHSGKIDKKALHDMEHESAVFTDINHSGNDLEEVILKSMKQVLNNQVLGSEDNFFRNGGQSIKAIALAKKLLEQGVKIKVNDIFQYQTAQQIASFLKKSHFNQADETTKESIQTSSVCSLDEAQMNSLVSIALARRSSASDFISGTDVIENFSLTPIQCGHYLSGSAFSGALIELIGEYSKYQIKDAVTKVIMDNQLLRSVIVSADDRLEWSEHSGAGFEIISRDSYGYLDVSVYSDEIKTQLLKQLAHDIFAVKYEPGTLRWNLCIVRKQAGNHVIVWGIDHVIFDGMSAEILKTQVEANLNPAAKALLQPIHPYSDYVKLLERGPREITSQSIINSFDLLNWSKLNKEIALKQPLLQADKLINEFAFDVSVKQMGDSDIWQQAIHLTIEILKEYFGMPVIPLVLVDSGRSYGGESYYNTIGEFLDLIPVMSDLVEDGSVGRLFQYCKDYSLNFLSLLEPGKTTDCYEEVRNIIKKDFYPNQSFFNFILFNFQGFVSKTDESTLSQITDDTKLGRTVVTAHYDEEKLHLEITDVLGLDGDKIMNIIKSQTDNWGDLNEK